MIEADEPSTGALAARYIECARPTGGSHGRTTDAPSQGRGGRKAKAALVEDDPVPQYNASNNTSII